MCSHQSSNSLIVLFLAQMKEWMNEFLFTPFSATSQETFQLFAAAMVILVSGFNWLAGLNEFE